MLLTDGQTDYIYGPDGLPIEQVDQAGNPTYYHHDQLGSTRLLTNNTGQPVGAYTYNPYGTLAQSTGSATAPLGYAGQYADPATGLQYDQARFYDPTTGQFLTPDPLQPLTQQPYAYADNNPTTYTDPTGLLFGISLDNMGNFAAGFGDTITFGATSWLRQQLGWDNVNYCSSAYADGGVGALAAAALIPGEGDTLLADEAAAEEAISMDEAIARGAAHVGPDGIMETTGNGLNYQFRGISTDSAGNTVARIGRFDVNPLDSHVAANGPHLNLETQVNGRSSATRIPRSIPLRSGRETCHDSCDRSKGLDRGGRDRLHFG